MRALGKVEVLTGNYAAAYAAKLAKVDVVAAYPITPQTTIVEKLDEFIENGELDARMIRVESEHSAMAASIGAAAAGARVFTATSSQGLFYMYEMLWWAAGARLPVVLAVVTRAVAPPWSIWTDHSDIMAMRDAGWVILFAETAQEVLDTLIQAFKIAEDEEVLLPVAVGFDAFVTSHTAEPVVLPSQETVDNFLPPRGDKPYVLDPDNPLSVGNLAYPNQYMELRYEIWEAMERARRVIRDADKRWEELTGRGYGGLVERFRTEDAEHIIVTMGAMAGDAREAVRIARKAGRRLGLCRVRSIRPFPGDELMSCLENAEVVTIVDRNVSFGKGGILHTEVVSALRAADAAPLAYGYIAGLGGRDVGYEDFLTMAEKSEKLAAKGEKTHRPIWYGLRWSA